MAKRVISGLALLAVMIGPSTAAMSSPIVMNETEAQIPALPPILNARERAATENRILAARLDTIIPAIMREQGVDVWLMVAREYFEEPVVASMLDAENMHARRRTILIFHDPGNGKPVERLTVSRYGLGGLFAPAWDPSKQPDQWQAVADIIAARDAMRARGATVLGTGEPRMGAHGVPVIFVHPRDTAGVLIELMATPAGH